MDRQQLLRYRVRSAGALALARGSSGLGPPRISTNVVGHGLYADGVLLRRWPKQCSADSCVKLTLSRTGVNQNRKLDCVLGKVFPD